MLTTLDYPIGFIDLYSNDPSAIEIMSLRNAVLIAVLVTAWYGLFSNDRARTPPPD